MHAGGESGRGGCLFGWGLGSGGGFGGRTFFSVERGEMDEWTMKSRVALFQYSVCCLLVNMVANILLIMDV